MNPSDRFPPSQPSHRGAPAGVRRLLRFARYSFGFRAALVLLIGTLLSSSGCSSCLSLAAWIGCNYCSNSGSDSDGCSFDDCDCDSGGGELEVCDDGEDNDGDGDIDCLDLDCTYDGACRERHCEDGRDNDGDGATDCDDADCSQRDVCRCLAQATCDAASVFCVSDYDSCEHECCGQGSECVEGHCVACDTDCSPGTTPCWSDGERCAASCCTPGQVCSNGECRCVVECEEGARPCLIDEWTCASECCTASEVCRGDGCSPYTCSAAVPVESDIFDFLLEWDEQEDALDLAGVEGCADSRGAEALFDVEVPAGSALHAMLDGGRVDGVHVIDACPPGRCEVSLTPGLGWLTLWINDSGEPEDLAVLLEAGGEAQGEDLAGWFELSTSTGRGCEAAIEVPPGIGPFTWSAPSRLFRAAEGTTPCWADGAPRVWFDIEVAGAQGLDAAAWTEVEGLVPVVGLQGGTCEAPRCLAASTDLVSWTNEHDQPQRVRVVVGWDAEVEGQVNVDLGVH